MRDRENFFYSRPAADIGYYSLQLRCRDSNLEQAIIKALDIDPGLKQHEIAQGINIIFAKTIHVVDNETPSREVGIYLLPMRRRSVDSKIFLLVAC